MNFDLTLQVACQKSSWLVFHGVNGGGGGWGEHVETHGCPSLNLNLTPQRYHFTMDSFLCHSSNAILKDTLMAKASVIYSSWTP